MRMGRPEYVSDLIVYLLNGLGVDYVPLNPGATTRGIHESIVTYGGQAFTELQHREWLAEAGFGSVERTACSNGRSIIVAHKPSLDASRLLNWLVLPRKWER